MQVLNSSRRSFMKWAAAAPLLSQIAVADLYAKAATVVGKDPRENCYTRLGVKTVINCRGTWTFLSGSLEFPEVHEAQIEAGKYFVNVLDLQRGIGRRLAELTGAESGMITSGAAGAMAVSTAACMAGADDKLVWQLPDTTGLKNEVVMCGGRSAFDSAIRLTGAKLVLTYLEMIRTSGCTCSTMSAKSFSFRTSPTTSMSGWSATVAITSSRIRRG